MSENRHFGCTQADFDSVRKTKRNSDFGFIFADLYAILAHLCAVLDLYVRLEFSATKADPLQKQIQIAEF